MIWGHSRPLVLHHFSFQRPLRLFPTRGHQEKTPQSPHFPLWAVLKIDFLGEEEVESELSPTKRFGDAQHRHWLTHPTECTGECIVHPPPTCQGPDRVPLWACLADTEAPPLTRHCTEAPSILGTEWTATDGTMGATWTRAALSHPEPWLMVHRKWERWSPCFLASPVQHFHKQWYAELGLRWRYRHTQS